LTAAADSVRGARGDEGGNGAVHSIRQWSLTRPQEEVRGAFAFFAR
jgi:hypothetical protein